jgi:hypothetical protein
MLAPFLSTYDPSDLPGGSIDPLGFDRGYLLLADKILPGLTNAAGRPRYFSLVCAGALLAPREAANDRELVRLRTDRVLRLERFWAAANVLASEDNFELSVSGIRGVTYAQAHVMALNERQARSTDADYKMLAHQLRYGAIGIYANVAGYVRLWDRPKMLPTPDLGERLGEAFLEETAAPAKLRKVIRDGDGDVGVDTLRAWGRSAHIASPVGSVEGQCLGEALERDLVRSRLAEMLRRIPRATEDEPELTRLRRLCKMAAKDTENADLQEAIEAILAFEEAYQIALLGFGRLLWLCKAEGSATPRGVARDAVLNESRKTLPEAAQRFERLVSEAATEPFRRQLERLQDVREFLRDASERAPTVEGYAGALLDRHADVQKGKYDRGRQKLPWIERKTDHYELTLSQVGDVSGEPKTLSDIRPHEYRLAAADRLIAASQGKSA